MSGSWAVDLVNKSWNEYFRKKLENENALDAGDPLPYPEIPVLSKEFRLAWKDIRLRFVSGNGSNT